MDINQKIIIATHELVYGVPQALRDYLIKKKASHLLFITLPFLAADKASSVLYENGNKIYEKINHRKKSLGFLDFFIDFFLVLYWAYSSKETYGLFIGVNNLNSLAGLLLRKIGKVKRVVFYTMDFVPIRFENKILNYIYHQVEIICIKKCDEIWNVSPRMAEGREKFLKLSQKKYPQKVIPVGTWTKKIKKRPLAQVKRNQILFIGHLSTEKQGVEVILDALPMIAKRIENVKFLIVGGGWYEDFLRDKTKKLKLENHVIFKGWILDRNQIDEMLSESAIAVATYKPEKERLRNFTYYADPYKIKDYLGAGLPIVLTDISYNAKDVAENKCGILVKYNKEEIADAIIKLLKDEKMLREFRSNALSYSKKFDWEYIYDKIFR